MEAKVENISVDDIQISPELLKISNNIVQNAITKEVGVIAKWLGWLSKAWVHVQVIYYSLKNLLVCKNEELLAITTYCNNISKKIWMRVEQARGNEDQPDKATAGSQWCQPCSSWSRTNWSRRIHREEVL